MRKILIWILSVLALLVLTACGEDQESQNTTELPHTHSYSSTVTPATCTEKGSETFTCSCGDTYTDEIPATGHDWSGWQVETLALVGKEGTEKQVCLICAVSETRTTTADAAMNSFMDWSLNYFFEYGDMNELGKNLVLTNMVEPYIDYIICRENDFPLETVVPAAEYLAVAQTYFVLDEGALFRLNPYNAETITVSFLGSPQGLYEVAGYVHNGGSRYTAYFHNPHDPVHGCVFAVELEYNLLEGQPNRYISIVRVESVPDHITE